MFLKVFFHDSVYEGGKTQNMTIACDKQFGAGDKFSGDSYPKIREILSGTVDFESFENEEHDLYLFECNLAYAGADQLARTFQKMYELVGTELEIDPAIHKDWRE